MGKLVIHSEPDPVQVAARRREEWLQLAPDERWRRLFQLISLSVRLNGGRPLKTPRGKGLIISKTK